MPRPVLPRKQSEWSLLEAPSVEEATGASQSCAAVRRCPERLEHQPQHKGAADSPVKQPAGLPPLCDCLLVKQNAGPEQESQAHVMRSSGCERPCCLHIQAHAAQCTRMSLNMALACIHMCPYLHLLAS